MNKDAAHIDILKISQDFSGFSPSRHLQHCAHNLALIADLGYGSMTLALCEDSLLKVVAARRTTTAIGPEVKERVGGFLGEDDEEAYQALATGQTVRGTRLRIFHDAEKEIDVEYFTSAHPVFDDGVQVGVLVRDVAAAQHDAPGRMESEFMQMAEELITLMSTRLLVDETNAPFVTTRRPGDGVLRIDALSHVEYPSPNAVAILRLAGYESRVRTSHAAELPGGGFAIASVVNKPLCAKHELSVAGRILLYRSIGLEHGAVVFVEDVTEVRQQQREVAIKEATIREVHHRVKNNLQTVAALLRMQGRRAKNQETKEALDVAMGRINSMAAVHALLSASQQESLDLSDVVTSVVDSIAASMCTQKSECRVEVSVEKGAVLPAPVITSLALVLTELVHNAYEHGLHVRTDQLSRESSSIRVNVVHNENSLLLEVRDSGQGLPDSFAIESVSSLGLTIVNTIVVQDLGGSLKAFNDNGAVFQVRIPRGDW